MRAVAILLVVAAHVGLDGLHGGFIGVDVFFVLSGYLITGLLVREMERGGRIDIPGFYARRARRLLPAGVVMIVATLLFAAAVMSPEERQLAARAAFAAAIYASNVWFQVNAAGYFDADIARNPLLHTWSLAVEEQFYLVWPALLAITLHRLGSKRALAIALAILCGASLALCMWLVATKPIAAFYALPARAWEFGIGGLAALIPSSALPAGRSRDALAGAGLLAVVTSAAVLDPGTPFPSGLALIPVLGTAVVLVTGAGGSTLPGRLLATAPFQHLGRLSYSWYLWHWPVLVLGAVMLPSLDNAGRVALAGLALGVSWLSFELVEAPVRYNRRLMRRTRATLALAVLVTIAVAAAARFATRLAYEAAETPQQRAIAGTRTIAPTLAASGCFADRERIESPACEFGAPGASGTIVLFGDSHAAQWFSAFERIAAEQGLKLAVFTKMGCPSASVDVRWWTARNAPYPECSAWRDAALRRIVALKPAVVIHGNSDNHVTAPGNRAAPRLALDEWRQGMRDTLDLLGNAGIQSIVLRDTPGPGLDVPTCLARAQSHGRPWDSCSAPRETAMRTDVFEAVKAAVAGSPHAHPLDLSDLFCDARVCPPAIGGEIVYGQPGHITHSFGRTLAPAIAVRMRSALPGDR